jgi:hypothetical protein
VRNAAGKMTDRFHFPGLREELIDFFKLAGACFHPLFKFVLQQHE